MNNTIRLACVIGIVLAGLILADSHAKVMGAQTPDGKSVFLLNCAACHQPNGHGGGPYPLLAGNPDVNAADSAGLIQTVLNGRTGPITVNGTQYGGNMPSWRELSDADIAAVLTYVRSAWHNSAPAVSADQVAAARTPVALSGMALFDAHCATCHQPLGQGTSVYPPWSATPSSRPQPRRNDRRDRQWSRRSTHRQRQNVQRWNADVERATQQRRHCLGRDVRSIGLGQ